MLVKMEKYTFGQSDYGVSGSGNQFSRGQEVADLFHQVNELHHLNESDWSFSQYKKQLGVSACKGSYNKERKMMRVRIDIEAPLQKVLTYSLYPPYGYRNMLERQGGNNSITERLGGGAVVAYQDNPGKTLCCCSIASRDCVVLAALKLPTSNTAIFGMKTIEHPSHPPRDDAYRINLPLFGLYLEEEGNVVHVESYVAEMDMLGKIGKVGPGKAMGNLVQKMIILARAIPRMQDIQGEAPYMQLM